MARQIFMIRPSSFSFNHEAAEDNAFASHKGDEDTQMMACHEFDGIVNLLKSHNIDVKVFHDVVPSLGPDAVFLNNWFSTHDDGKVLMYPMYCANRRPERRHDIIEYLQTHYEDVEVDDLTSYENKSKYLESTGSMIFDHQAKLVYAALSNRTNATLVEKVAKIVGYEPVIFNTHAVIRGKVIYHTNVMMSVCTRSVVCCMDVINEKEVVKEAIRKSGKQLLDISMEQVLSFLGNILEVRDREGNLFTVMSDKAYESLREDQKAQLEQESTIIHSSVDTIEKVGGGGIRCMMAEVWCQKDSSNASGED